MIRGLDKFFCGLAITVIKLYQKSLSPNHSKLWRPRTLACRFHPSCSQYAIDCYQKYNFIYASIKVVWRILRCQPFNSGGYDPA